MICYIEIKIHPMIQNPAVHPPDQPFAPFDFTLTKTYQERARLTKKIVATLQMVAMTFENSKAWSEERPLLFLETTLGELEMEVSQKTYDLWQVDDHIVVEFQRGRWTGNLKGKICRR